MILLAEHDEPILAAKKKRQVAASESLTSTPKNRVWGFENTASGRPSVEPQLSWENATGSVQYTYQIASGRAEWLSRDPLKNAEMRQGPNLYDYVHNSPVEWRDPLGLAGGGGLPQDGFGGSKNGSSGSGGCDNTPYGKILLGFETFPIAIGISAALSPWQAAAVVVGGAYVYYNSSGSGDDDPNSQPDGPPEEVP